MKEIRAKKNIEDMVGNYQNRDKKLVVIFY